jgi:hypothetical protein
MAQILRKDKNTMKARRLCVAGGMAHLATSLEVTQAVLPKLEDAFKGAKSGPTYKGFRPGTIALNQTSPWRAERFHHSDR